jgi:hypothetical protein
VIDVGVITTNHFFVGSKHLLVQIRFITERDIFIEMKKIEKNTQ